MYAVVALPPAKNHQSRQSAYDVAAILADKLAVQFGDGIPTKSSAHHIRKYGCTIFFADIHEATCFTDRISDSNLPDKFFKVTMQIMVPV